MSSWRSASATPSAASCGPSAPTCTAACASTCCATRPGAGPRRPTARTRTTSASWAPRSHAGVQRHVMACVKHFACNSMENARFKVDVTVDEEALHEVYLPHFKRIVDEGVAAVMSAYNAGQRRVVRRQQAAAHRRAARRVGLRGLRDQRLDLRHARRRRGRSTAGLDVEMPYRMMRAGGLRAALDAGEASWDDVDRSVVRIVSTLQRFADVLGADRTRPIDPGVRRAPGRSHARRRPSRWCCCATSRSTERPCCRSTPARSARSP